jgi:hypothetical protein
MRKNLTIRFRFVFIINPFKFMRFLCNLNNCHAVVIVWSLCLFILNFSPGIAQAQTRFGVPVQIEVPVAPTPVKAEGKLHLVYELHITNFRAPELTLLQVDVLVTALSELPSPATSRRRLQIDSRAPALRQICPTSISSAAG